MKAPNVILFPADKAGCGFYRMRWPGGHLASQGHPVEIRDKVRPGDDVTGADVVVIQRPLRMVVVRFIEWLQRSGVAVVVEIDDSLHNLPTGHPLKDKVVSYEREEGETAEALRQACELADLVTCTTPALAKFYAPHGRHEIIPNMVPRMRILAGMLHLEHELAIRDRPTTIGYFGPAHFHKWDLGVVGKGVAQAMHQTGAEFYGIGSPALPAVFGVKGTAENWRDMHDYGPDGYVAGQCRADLGLAPLTMCHFNDCKSDLKVLELAALGIPSVASPSPSYLAAAAATDGAIRLARVPREWREQIIGLIAEPPEPTALLEWAWSRTIEGNAPRWVNAWTRARDLSASRSSAASSPTASTN